MQSFPDKARVCFVGDSITNCNQYVAHIAGYYKEHLGESGVEFYNCGISGATLSTTLAVFDEDILPFEPTHVVLMIGINDSARHYLEGGHADRYDGMTAAFERYKKNLSVFCERVKNLGAELIICTPTPYAEYIESDIEPLRGGAAMMLGYCEYLKTFAKENGYPLCDYHSYITRELTLSSEPLYSPDRVHPLPLGHYYMAKCFLAFQGFELDKKELPECILPWHSAVCELRNTIATEHFILNDDFSTTDEERMAAILEFAQNPKEGPHKEYFTSLAVAYPERKRKQKENLEFVKRFMKNQ